MADVRQLSDPASPARIDGGRTGTFGTHPRRMGAIAAGCAVVLAIMGAAGGCGAEGGGNGASPPAAGEPAQPDPPPGVQGNCTRTASGSAEWNCPGDVDVMVFPRSDDTTTVTVDAPSLERRYIEPWGRHADGAVSLENGTCVFISQPEGREPSVSVGGC